MSKGSSIEREFRSKTASTTARCPTSGSSRRPAAGRTSIWPVSCARRQPTSATRRPGAPAVNATRWSTTSRPTSMAWSELTRPGSTTPAHEALAVILACDVLGDSLTLIFRNEELLARSTTGRDRRIPAPDDRAAAAALTRCWSRPCAAACSRVSDGRRTSSLRHAWQGDGFVRTSGGSSWPRAVAMRGGASVTRPIRGDLRIVRCSQAAARGGGADPRARSANALGAPMPRPRWRAARPGALCYVSSLL